MRRVMGWIVASLVTFAMVAMGSGVKAEKTPEYMGFLGDYSKLAPDPEEKDSKLIYKIPKTEEYAASITGLKIDPLVLYFYPSDEAREIDPKKAERYVTLANLLVTGSVNRSQIVAAASVAASKPTIPIRLIP